MRVSGSSREIDRNDVQVARPVRFEPNTLILVLTSARRCGISPRQLERLVRRHLNDSPMKYYLKIRLQAARNLLFYTDRPTQEIALASGFSSAQLLSRSSTRSFASRLVSSGVSTAVIDS